MVKFHVSGDFLSLHKNLYLGLGWKPVGGSTGLLHRSVGVFAFAKNYCLGISLSSLLVFLMIYYPANTRAKRNVWVWSALQKDLTVSGALGCMARKKENIPDAIANDETMQVSTLFWRLVPPSRVLLVAARAPSQQL